MKGTARLIASLPRRGSGAVTDGEKMWIWGQKDALFLALGGHVTLALILVIYFVYLTLYMLYIVYFLIYHVYIIYKVNIESHANCVTSFYACKMFCIKYMLKLQKSNSTQGLGNPLKFGSRVLLETVLNKVE